MTFNIINILLLFGLLQCTVMIGLILKNRNWHHVENRILLGLLSVLLVTLIPPFLGNSRLVQQHSFLQFAPLYLSLFVFPLIYLYVRSIFAGQLRKKAIVVHLGTPILFWSYFTFIWLGTLSVAAESKGIWARSFGYFTAQTLHYLLLIVFTVGYTIASVLSIQKEQNHRVPKEYAKFKAWIKILIMVLGIGVVLEMTAMVLGKFYGYWRGSPIDEWLGFSFVFGVKIYNAAVLYGISLLAYISYSSLRHKKIVIGAYEAKILESITDKMQIEKMYLDPNLTLSKFSSDLGITPGKLSAILNHNQGTTFNDFVNGYRVQEVMHLVKGGKNGHLTLEAIAANAGFKSKTTFYRAFKKITSKTPRVYFQEVFSVK